jgi:hypothetical protein
VTPRNTHEVFGTSNSTRSDARSPLRCLLLFRQQLNKHGWRHDRNVLVLADRQQIVIARDHERSISANGKFQPLVIFRIAADADGFGRLGKRRMAN